MPWQLPDNFDGAAFRDRYNLGEWDFVAVNGMLALREGVTLPDDPPIMEQCVAENIAKRERVKIVGKLQSDDDPMLKLLLLICKKVHAKLDTIEKRGGQPTRVFAEWQTEVLNEFVNGG